MGKWLKKMGTFADSVIDTVKDEAMEHIDNIEDKIQSWVDIGQQCREISTETIQICNETQTQRESMIQFASDIQSTLENGLGGEQRSADGDGTSAADILNTIKELTAGDKVKAAMDLATGLNEIAKQCVDKSIKLTDLLEKGMDELPDFIEKALTDSDDEETEGQDRDIAPEDDPDSEIDDLIRGLDNDIKDVETCITEIQHLNLQSAMKVGLNAFVQLSDKAKRSRTLFDSIQKYADDIYTITHSFTKEKMLSRDAISTIRTVAKSMMRSIRCSEIMRLASEGAGKLLNIIVNLFDVTANQVSKLWSALAFAKDCMVDCIGCVVDAMKVCTKAKDTSTSLIDKCKGVTSQLKSASQLNVNSIRSLATDGNIQETIDLATTIDDDILACTENVIKMIQRVNDGFNNLPDILTGDMDKTVEGKADDDPETPNVDDDITTLETSNRELEESDIMSATSTGERGFEAIVQYVEKCLKMVLSLEDFATQSDRSIQSFLTVWDLESISSKLTDMCRIVNLGEMMQNVADNIKRLLSVIINYMKTAFEKFTKLPLLNADGIQDAVEDGKEFVDDAIDNIKDKFKIFGRK